MELVFDSKVFELDQMREMCNLQNIYNDNGTIDHSINMVDGIKLVTMYHYREDDPKRLKSISRKVYVDLEDATEDPVEQLVTEYFVDEFDRDCKIINYEDQEYVKLFYKTDDKDEDPYLQVRCNKTDILEVTFISDTLDCSAVSQEGTYFAGMATKDIVNDKPMVITRHDVSSNESYVFDYIVNLVKKKTDVDFYTIEEF